MSTIHVGPSSVLIIENEGGRAMSAEAYRDRLDAVLKMINMGSIGGGTEYGCKEHKDALDDIENQIIATRKSITRIQDEFIKEVYSETTI